MRSLKTQARAGGTLLKNAVRSLAPSGKASRRSSATSLWRAAAGSNETLRAIIPWIGDHLWPSVRLTGSVRQYHQTLGHEVRTEHHLAGFCEHNGHSSHHRTHIPTCPSLLIRACVGGRKENPGRRNLQSVFNMAALRANPENRSCFYLILICINECPGRIRSGVGT